MADNQQMAAETRAQFGKGAARKLRVAGKVPAVVYGHGEQPLHVSLPAHEMMLVARRANALLELNLEDGKKLVLVKDVQRDPVRQIIEHVDMVVVRKGEKVTVDIGVHVEGEPFSGTMVQYENLTITAEAEATNIPEWVTISIEGLTEGTQIHAGELPLPDGSTLVSDPEALILSIYVPRAAAEEDDTTTDAAAEGDAGGASGGADSSGDSSSEE
ncbi:large subunit ribosomal protein L25 / Ctc stress response protein [Pontimonas salivibrio]|uniref:Large ribosomal subunit protein bL25 n=1 Tax=Pontimonas salivibrio TaxID=1159327 RepID=A0A2L2BPA8_9MICO|nr:50S ribosomal protein L25/general stress protein Ctc [Pontimonas salivibrio]AVG23501.1 large subunit ribosomal protein L25 / Ctc stress response protein [Pontimonas salivibrio]